MSTDGLDVRPAGELARRVREICGGCFELGAQADAVVEALALANAEHRAPEILAVVIGRRANSLSKLSTLAARNASSGDCFRKHRDKADRYARIAVDLRALLSTSESSS
jgi:hypothetical protein